MKITKKLIAIALASAVAVSVPLIVCAETYDLSAGSVTVSNDAAGRYVTQENGCTRQLETTETVIEMKDQTTTSNTISLNNQAGDLEVTIRNVNIQSAALSEVPIEISGQDTAGSTTVNIEGENTLAGFYGITSSCPNDVTIQGKDDSASIDITAYDSGISTYYVMRDNTLTLSNLDLDIDSMGYAVQYIIHAVGSSANSGKLVIENSDVDIDNAGIFCEAIGTSASVSLDIIDSNVDLDTAFGTIAFASTNKDCGEPTLDGCSIVEPTGGEWTLVSYENNMYLYTYTVDGNEVTKLLIVQGSDTSPAEEAEETSYYRILNEKGARCSYTSEREDSVLTINCERDYAKLILTQAEMNELLDDGIDTVKFVTNGAESRFKLADVLAEIKPGAQLSDLHDGKDVTLLLGKEEANKLLG